MTQDGNVAAGTALSTDRLEFLQDGVFAIVMTLLVIEFHVPEAHSQAELAEKLFEMWPMLLAYFVSFANLSVFWVGQHLQFHYIERTDRVMLWINLAFLSFVALIPFTTALVSEDMAFQLPYIIYGINLLIISGLSYLGWHYATKHHRLTDHDVTPALVRGVKLRVKVAPAIALLAMIASFISMPISLALYFLIPLYYMMPGRLDRNWRQPAIPHTH
jgi:uncharacterized membrane protein